MLRTSARIQLNKQDREAIAGMTRRLDAKMSRLRSVVPHVLDLSALEGRLPAPCGGPAENHQHPGARVRPGG